MKTLDDAVIELNGVWSFKFDELVTFEMSQPPKRLVYSKLQFQQRAKELGFINGYRWGIEYKTDGKRPDLPGDVGVSAVGKTYYSFANNPAGGVLWGKADKFIISDPRHKPADTSYLEKPALEPVPEEEGWYDYDNQNAIVGKFPKHLEVVIVNTASGIEFEVVGQSSSGSVVVQRSDNGEFYSFHLHQLKPLDYYRKAKAERKRALDVIYNKWNERGDIVEVAEWLYDKGFLKLPE